MELLQGLPQMSLAEYLHFEAGKEERHEFHDGGISMVSGGTVAHNEIVGNVFAWLHTALRGSGSWVYTSTMKLKIEATNSIVYPDVLAGCSPRPEKGGKIDFLESPLLIVEVLSPGTEAYDRGQKFFKYRQLPSLQEYVMVSQREAHVEVISKGDFGWGQHKDFVGLSSVVKLESLQVEIPMAEVYQNVAFLSGEA